MIAKCPDVLVNTCNKYLEYVQPLLSGPNRHLDFIMNMDKTGVVFNMSPTSTLKAKGIKTITIRSTGARGERAMVSIAITALGKVLTPYLVYKGKPGWLIKKDDLWICGNGPCEANPFFRST